MTYTFKLARRLAVSREYSMLAALAVLVACSGETTAPDTTRYSAPPSMIGLRVVPNRVTIETSQRIRFRGERRDPRAGRMQPVSLIWESSGGVIDAEGIFSATTAGTYKVTGRGRGRHKPDTSIVVVVPPQPDVVGVVVTPDSVALAPAATYTYAANGLLSDGTTVPIGVTWQATGGTIDAGGLYTAGATPGSYRVIAVKTDAVLADTVRVTIPEPATPAPPPSSEPAPPSGPTGLVGIPFGPSQMPLSTSSSPFTLRHDGVSPSVILSRINAARTSGTELLFNMTGGDHSRYMSTINGVYQFDMDKWKAAMELYNTSAIRTAVAQAVADGVVIGNSVMDEPHVCGAGDGNTWGPCGTMTKARVDSMCGYVKTIFPTLPVGVAHNHTKFEPAKSYRVCEFDITQFSYMGKVGLTDFRDGALAMAARDHIAIVFSINILNGGNRDTSGAWDCPQSGVGTYGNNCWMTPSQLQESAAVLGPAGCAFKMWRYDQAFMSNVENEQAFNRIAAQLAVLPRKSCSR